MERLGFVLVWVGFAFGLVAVGWAGWRLVHREVSARIPRMPAALAVAGAVIASGSLWLTWIEGFLIEGNAPGGWNRARFGTFTGWAALDPVSTGLAALLGAVILALVLRHPPGAPRVLVATCSSLAALVGGNVLIQATTTRGSHLRYGGYVAAVGVVLLLAAAGVLVRTTSTPEP